MTARRSQSRGKSLQIAARVSRTSGSGATRTAGQSLPRQPTENRPSAVTRLAAATAAAAANARRQTLDDDMMDEDPAYNFKAPKFHDFLDEEEDDEGDEWFGGIGDSEGLHNDPEANPLLRPLDTRIASPADPGPARAALDELDEEDEYEQYEDTNAEAMEANEMDAENEGADEEEQCYDGQQDEAEEHDLEEQDSGR